MSIVLSEFAQTITDINFGTGAKSPLPPLTMLDDAFLSPLRQRESQQHCYGGEGGFFFGLCIVPMYFVRDCLKKKNSM